ncbi:DUF4404 family protein [Streptomyces sp. G-G2]|uniref:DUF4404 family protein n=1 Tax=Streptomyces sp. G-G2 TaxID=3046201 RepID=UPI0024BAEE75|nr:DUF4404 family protein [Streptomyces sp. G-G2]MDJ0382332.1 DUF4404 family protein [Streptomyces sp. G-G2]
MSDQELKASLAALRGHTRDTSLSPEDRAHLEALTGRLEAQARREDADRDGHAIEGLNLAVARFELSHPRIGATLNSIAQSLASLGI